MSFKRVMCSKHPEYASNFVCDLCGNPKCFDCYSAKKSGKELTSCVDCRTKQTVEQDATVGIILVAMIICVSIFIGFDFWRELFLAFLVGFVNLWNSVVLDFFHIFQ